jgi:hypothetical protein
MSRVCVTTDGVRIGNCSLWYNQLKSTFHTHKVVSSVTLLLTMEIPWLTISCHYNNFRPKAPTSGQVKVEVIVRLTVSRPVCLVVRHPSPITRFLLLSDRCGFVDVGRPLWRENESVAYKCHWSSPVKSFFGLSPTRLNSYLTVSDSRLLQPGGPGPRIYIPQEQGGPVTPPGTGWLPASGLGWFSWCCPGSQRTENTSSVTACSYWICLFRLPLLLSTCLLPSSHCSTVVYIAVLA